MKVPLPQTFKYEAREMSEGNFATASRVLEATPGEFIAWAASVLAEAISAKAQERE